MNKVVVAGIAAGILLGLIITSTNAYATQTERIVTVNLDGKSSVFSITAFSFAQTAFIHVDEKLYIGIVDRFGTHSFVFRSQTPMYVSGDSFVKIEPRIQVGKKLEVEFVVSTAAGPISKSISLSSKIDSPKKQMVMGVTAEDVLCEAGKTLMIRNLGSAACVKPSTATRLEGAGWGTIVKEFVSKSDVTIPNLTSEEVKSIAEEAYIYGYPLVLMDLTSKKMSNVPKAGPQTAPINQFAHMPEFPSPDFKDVVSPNADTLYSIAWLDLSDEPIILHVPDTNGRYYLMPMIDAWTNVFASPGKRTTGTEVNNFVITGPFWEGKLPDGLTEIKSPTNLIWIIGRTQTNGVDDYDAVHVIQKEYTLTPLNSFGKSYQPSVNVPVDSSINMITPPVDQVAGMDTFVFFNRMAIIMKDNPPDAEDTEMLKKFEKIGLHPGKKFDINNLDPNTANAVASTVKIAQEKNCIQCKKFR